MKFHRIYLFFFSLNLIIGCNRNESVNSYLADIPFQYYKTIQYSQLDSISTKIKEELPKTLWLKVCESIWYASPIRETNLQLQLKALDILEQKFPVDSISAFILMERGSILSSLMDYDSAEICFKKAYDLSIKEDRYIRANDIRSEWGALLVKRGKYPEGIDMQLGVYEVLKKLGSENGSYLDGGRFFEIMYGLAQSHRNINDLEMALFWDKKMHRYSAKIPNSGYQIQSASTIAEDYYLMNHLDSAKLYIDTCLYLMKKYQIFYIEGKYRLIKAAIEAGLGNCSLALEELNQSLRDTSYLSLPKAQSRFFYTKGDVFACQNNIDSAIFFYQKALSRADTIRQIDILNKLAIMSKKKQEFAESLKYTEEGNTLRTRLLTLDKYRNLERQKAQIEAEQQTQITRLNYEKKILWYLISILSLVIGLLITLFYFFRLRNNQKILQQEKVIAETLTQLKTQELTQAENKISEQESEIKETQKQLEFKNQLINQLEISLADKDFPNLNGIVNTDSKENLRGMRILTKEDWQEFKRLFDTYYPDFSLKLKSNNPNLSNSEMRLFLLIKAGFDNIEIASMLGVSISSIYKSRYRLRRKLGLSEDEILDKFILGKIQ